MEEKEKRKRQETLVVIAQETGLTGVTHKGGKNTNPPWGKGGSGNSNEFGRQQNSGQAAVVR